MRTPYAQEGLANLERIYAPTFEPFSARLEAGALIAEAELATGLADWGGPEMAEAGFRKRLEKLSNSLEDEALLTDLGRTRAHGRVLAMLIGRLRTVDHVRQSGALPPIQAPLIGTGMPRSGTSFLQALLAQDPDNLVPITAHGMAPIPPPGVLQDETARMQLVGRMIAFQGLDTPEVNAIHPMAPDAEDEDVLFQEAACGSLFQAFFNVPSYVASLQDDFGELHAWQKQLMQIIQTHSSARRWVLKAPEYLGRLDAIRALYPDGMIFVNHRDPAKVLASIASLYMTFQSLNSPGAIPPEYLGPPMLQGQAQAFRAFEDWRAANPTVHVVDVHYKELVADPMAEAERLYAAFGIPMSPRARECMNDFLKTNRHGQDSQGVKHTYTLAEFGLTEDMIEETLGDYIDRYGIERERRG